MNKNLYYIIAGEPSGDLHGASLMNEIKSYNPKISFKGLGGSLMKNSGLETSIDFQRLSVMGFWEVLKDIRFFLKLKKNILESILESQPEKIILIDYPGFNLSLAKSLKSKVNIPIIYYISPQVWAWKKKRVYAIKKYVDELIVVFPFEVDWFKKYNFNVKFFGHPLIDQSKGLSLEEKNINSNTIALFPGSRIQEIKKHLPILNQTVRLLKQKNSKLNYILNVPVNIPVSMVKSYIDSSIEVVQKKSSDVFSMSSAAIVTSGTATLECAIANTPFIVIYKTSFVSWIIVKIFLSVPFICIVNLLANKKIIPELIQQKSNPKNISQHLLRIMDNPEKIKKDLLKVKNILGDGTSYKKTAQYIVNYD